MKGMLNEKGSLMIERAGRFKIMECREGREVCSDSCVLFGEPKEFKIARSKEHGAAEKEGIETKTNLDLCLRSIHFDDFKDERIKED